MKKLNFLSIVLFAIGLNVSSVDARKISDELEIPIYFSIASEKVYLKTGWNDDYSARQFLIVTKSDLSAEILAVVHLVELAPNYYFNQSYELENVKNIYPIFQNANNIASIANTLRYGDFEYTVFTADGLECLTFVNETEESSSDSGVPEGTRRMLGYLCAPNRMSLTDAGIRLFFESIGMKATGEEPPADENIFSKLFN